MESGRGLESKTTEEERLDSKYKGFNPPYIEQLLRKDVCELLEWLRESLLEMASVTVPETQYHADQEKHGAAHAKSDTQVGIRILDGKLVLYRLVLEEIKSRLEAIEPEAREVPTLLPGKD